MSKTILITGASSGIGKETAKLFAYKGWKVAATMRSPEKEKELQTFTNIKIYQLDVTKKQSIDKAVQDTIKDFGGIDVIVNNAGYSLVGAFEASDDEAIQKELQTNIFGVMQVTKLILPYFRERRKGIIINVASMGGRITFPLYSVYHASKWAVEGFSESLQHELKEFNIKVKIIEPGIIKTAFYGQSAKVVQKSGLTAYDNFVNKSLPYMMTSGNKGSDPSEIARLIFKAATDNSSKLRYIGGKNAKLILTMRRILPDSLFNGIIRRIALSNIQA